MNFDFINDLRLQLETNNIFAYSIIGAKMAAILLLFFSILERWGKNVLGQSNNSGITDLVTILGYVLLIISSDFLFDTIENFFAFIDVSVNTTETTTYTRILTRLAEQEERIRIGAGNPLAMLGAIGSNMLFYIGFTLASLIIGVVKIADMSMVIGYLISRMFFIQILQFLFPIAVALSTIKATSNLISKWLKLYIGISLLGLVYIGIIKIIALVEESLSANMDFINGDGTFDAYLSLNVNVWSSIVVIIVVFSLKVTLFNKSTSFVINYFSS